MRITDVINEEFKDPNEYDMEGRYAKNQLETIKRMALILSRFLSDEDNLPEWVQEKLARAEGMMVAITDYLISEKALDHETIEEAEYQGHKVQLNKPMQGDVKKFKVYVKDPKTGNVKKVNFGDPNMRIKKSNPKRRKSFRARHHCENPGPKTKARYWSCKKW